MFAADGGWRDNLVVPSDLDAGVSTPQTGPSPADGVERKLDPRFIPLERTVGWITTGTITLGLLIAVAVFSFSARPPGWVLVLTVGGAIAAIAWLAWLAQYWPEISYRHAFYRVDARGIEIRIGVVWRSVINIPRSRVQHTDVSQGPLERRYGLGTLVLYTAGTDHAKVDLRGLDRATALAIRDHLLPREPDDAV